MTKNPKTTTSDTSEPKKLFSLFSPGKAKPVKAGKKAVGAVSRVEKDGSIVISENFDNSPESMEEALASPNIFGNIDKYISDIKKLAGLDIDIEDKIKMRTLSEKKKDDK
jgi:surface antigen